MTDTEQAMTPAALTADDIRRRYREKWPLSVDEDADVAWLTTFLAEAGCVAVDTAAYMRGYEHGADVRDQEWRAENADRDESRRFALGEALGWNCDDYSPSWQQIERGIGDLRALAATHTEPTEEAPLATLGQRWADAIAASEEAP